MAKLSDKEIMLLELDSAWEYFGDANAETFQKLKDTPTTSWDARGVLELIELAFKAGYTNGASMAIAQMRKELKG